MTVDLRGRTAEDVLARHLELRRNGDLEDDLAENYSPDITVLTARQVYRGHDGVRRCAHRLWEAAAGGEFSYRFALAGGRMALLEWSGRTDRFWITAGVDSYLVEDGWFVAQTIHYRVEDGVLSIAGGLLTPVGEPGPHAIQDPDRLRPLGSDGGARRTDAHGCGS